MDEIEEHSSENEELNSQDVNNGVSGKSPFRTVKIVLGPILFI